MEIQNTCTQTLLVEDVEDPVISCPADLTVTTDLGLCTASGVVLGTPTISDNCSVTNVSDDAPTLFNDGYTTVTYTVEDASGNTSTCTQLVTVEDIENPMITCPTDIVVNTDTGMCSASGVELGTPVATDNCSVASLSDDGPVVFSEGSTVVTYTVEDTNGNSSSCTQVVIIEDNEAPIITCPSDLTVNTDTDLCTASGISLGNYTISDNCGVVDVSDDRPVVFNLGNTIIVYVVQDASGNSASCTQNITVVDNQAPEITCPSDITVSAEEDLCYVTEVELGIAVGSDNCPSPIISNNANEPYFVGETIITYTITDASGNQSSCNQIITVVESGMPMITCPDDLTVNTDLESCSATNVELGDPILNDNCGSVTYINDAIEPFELGLTNIIYTATDESGNTDSCIQEITVVDNENPLITCPADITVMSNNPECTALNIELGDPTAIDNCPDFTLSYNENQIYSEGNNTVIWTVTDFFGNQATCSQIVTVEECLLTVDDYYTTSQETSISIDILLNDLRIPEEGSITLFNFMNGMVDISVHPDSTAFLEAYSFVYTPDNGFFGRDSFELHSM